MNRSMILLVALIGLAMMGCVKQHSATVENSNLSQCKMQCLNRLKTCQAVCNDDCQHCLKKAKITAHKHYHRFIHQQVEQGGLLARNLKSYRDPLQCLKATCNCHADFHQCSASCTGTIFKRLQSPLTCC
jgi:hypothetical protein